MSKDTYIQKRRQHLRTQASQPSDFIQRNYPFFLFISLVLYPIAMVWSMATESGNIYTRAMELLHNHTAAATLTVLIILLIEGGVIVAGIGASNDITEGSFAESGKDLQMFIGKLILFLSCYALSCTLSLDGSTQTTHWISETYAAPTLTTTDSIDQVFADRIGRQEAMIADARKMTWRGKITRKGQATIAGAQETIDRLESEYATAIAQLNASNQSRMAEWESETQENSGWAWYFSVFGQLIMMACIVLRTIYKSGENNLVHNLETLTGRDFDGDGQVGKPAEEASPTPKEQELEDRYRQAWESTPMTKEEIAAAVAAELERRSPQRRQVRPFGYQPEAESTGPQARATAPQRPDHTYPPQAVALVAQASQSTSPQVVKETVHVMVGDLKKNITTYYPRCWSKEQVGKKGSASQDTRRKNKDKVIGWAEELEQYGITAIINWDEYQSVTYKTQSHEQ